MIEWNEFRDILRKNILFCEENKLCCENKEKAEEVLVAIHEATNEGIVLKLK